MYFSLKIRKRVLYAFDEHDILLFLIENNVDGRFLSAK
jgi:hypothetical protein